MAVRASVDSVEFTEMNIPNVILLRPKQFVTTDILLKFDIANGRKIVDNANFVCGGRSPP